MIKLGSSKAIFAKEDRNKPNFADPNIVRVELHRLSESQETDNLQPNQCSQCQSYYSNEKIENNSWKCHFCGNENHIEERENEMKEEIKEKIKEENDYFIEKKEIQVTTESTIVFCIDISGSMSGHPLECVKKAIIQQISELKKANSHQKICIVQFSNTVDILGDCCHNEINIPSRMMNDYDSLVDIAKDNVVLFELQQTADNLIRKVKQMNTRGSTALGPAVLVSTVLAGKESNGQVILCTDGCANVGLQGREFYNKVADYAIEHGVIININTVDGCHANVTEIREMSMKTGGNVTVLRVEDLGEAFSDIMSNKLVAKQTTLTIHLPQSIIFDDLENNIIQKNRDKRNPDGTLSHITIYKGNIIDDSDFYFRYKLNTSLLEMESFPIQIVIEYTKLNGGKWRRIVNKRIKVAKVGEKCENDGEIIQAYYIRRVGESNQEGNIKQTRENIQIFRHAQMAYFQVNQQLYTNTIDEYEYGLNHQHDDYYSSKTAYTSNFSSKRMMQQNKYQKQDYKTQQMSHPQNNNMFNKRSQRRVNLQPISQPQQIPKPQIISQPQNYNMINQLPPIQQIPQQQNNNMINQLPQIQQIPQQQNNNMINNQPPIQQIPQQQNQPYKMFGTPMHEPFF